MGWLRSLLIILILLATIAAGALFALQNTTPVALDLLLIQLPERTLALWVLLALALGIVLGLLSGGLLLLTLKARLRVIQRQADKLALEVDRLRRVGLADSE